MVQHVHFQPRVIGEHRHAKDNAPGRLFWQGLNESVWLVYAIQGYDAIYDTLTGIAEATPTEPGSPNGSG